MKTHGTISIDGIQMDWKQSERKNGKQILTVQSDDGDELKIDKIDLLSTAAREQFAGSLIEYADVEQINAALLRFAADLASDEDDEEQGEEAELDYLDSMPQEVRDEARAMVESPDLMEQIVRDISVAGVAGESDLAKTLYLVGTSRLLAKPVSAIVHGSSSSGKSYVLETVNSLFPPEAKAEATQITPKALFHLPPGSLEHRWVVAGERSRNEGNRSAEATRALREMISSGKLRLLVPRKRDGVYVTEVIEQEGPIAYTESTTLTQCFAEDSNRMLILNTDEHTQQTQLVIEQLGKTYSNGNAKAEKDRVIAKHHAAQRMLKQHDVVVPFADRLASRFPVNRVEARRGFPQLMSMIQAMCLLHQFQRETDENGRLIATEADYRIARDLLLKPLRRLLLQERVSDTAAGFLERLKQRFQVDENFTATQAARGEVKQQRRVEQWMEELREAGLIQRLEASRGQRPATWQLSSGPDVLDEHSVLPTVEDIFCPEEPAELLMAS